MSTAITYEIFRQSGEDVPLIDPAQAGKNLAGISLEYDFVLYEYFQTDIRGHKRNVQDAVRVVETLDQFLGGYLAIAESVAADKDKMAFILTSDLGILRTYPRQPYRTKVPALCWSNLGYSGRLWKDIEDCNARDSGILLK
jgi:hypothetical protein